MTEKNDFKLDVVSIRLVKEAPIYSEQSFNKPEEVAAVMGECMCQFDREVVCVVNLSSDLKPIRKMHKLQEQYLFLARHNIHSAEELVGTIASLTDKKKETSAEKSRIYKARERSMELFTAADEMENLKPAEQSYRLGDIFFEDEHRKWVALEQELQAQGYSLEEVQALRRHYKEEYSEVCAREKVVCRELNTGKAILNSMIPDSISDGRKTEYNREIIRDRKEQPVR